tara:strand:+ start:9449 stop:14683 length:5235 start_codon:yes stop_codon:yes gene_type:complete
MPLNKLENFIKNTEGKILYVNPNDLDATDSITNQGNSLTKPFKTIQRALLESARFSYQTGFDNDITDKTTILLFPGDHFIDNRPGFAIKKDPADPTRAVGVSPIGAETLGTTEFALSLTSEFDLTVENNQLYRFNSVNGGVIVPRGTSIVGLDLRKTKIRPLYVPNPTDDDVPGSCIFRITGNCYFWQFSLFDGKGDRLVFTDHQQFNDDNRSFPSFSHHKLTCFEYADGKNEVKGYDITDLSMYYYKLTYAFQEASGRAITYEWPENQGDFEAVRQENEIVGALGTDPLEIASIVAGDGLNPTSQITVTTEQEHGLSAGTPIKISGVNVSQYNISTIVQSIVDATTFTYNLATFPNNLPATPSNITSAVVTIESDTVTGASPYIFNISLRSVFGMNGMHTDGSKATGFRSMVVAQFTGISLQKDDRAFVKYNNQSRLYEGITYQKVTGSLLSAESSSTDATTVYHLDSGAIYRQGWEQSHIKISENAVVQVVSVFAIGYNAHFVGESGADASITNSNSNFGQFALLADGFRDAAFPRDDQGYITHLTTPQHVNTGANKIDTVSFYQLDVSKTKNVGLSSHLYIFGFDKEDDPPLSLSQGFRIGANFDEKLFVSIGGTEYSADVRMAENILTGVSTAALGDQTGVKKSALSVPNTQFAMTTDSIGLVNGEKIRIFSDSGDLPEGLQFNRIYYAIVNSPTEIKVASTFSNAINNVPIELYGGQNLRVVSTVSDKQTGEIGHPIQWDLNQNQWFLHVEDGNTIYPQIQTNINLESGSGTNISFIRRFEDKRSIEDKLYKVRYVIPKEAGNSRDPVSGFIVQNSSLTGFAKTSDPSSTTITLDDNNFRRNHQFIADISETGGVVTVTTELPHMVEVGDIIFVENVQDSNNTPGLANKGYNGYFTVTGLINAYQFNYSSTDNSGVERNTGNFVSTVNTRNLFLPRFAINNNGKNFSVYRSTVVEPYLAGQEDGVYILELLSADFAPPQEFTPKKYEQNVTFYYPQQDRDNILINPPAAKSFARRSPLGKVDVNDLKNSLTRETVDKFLTTFNVGYGISNVTAISAGVCTVSFTNQHDLNGLVAHENLVSATGYGVTEQYNVKLLNGGIWQGATATVTVGVGSTTITGFEVFAPGSGFQGGETLTIEDYPGSSIGVPTSGISSCIGDVVAITGIGTTSDGLFRITSVPDKNSIAIAVTSGDPQVISGQYAYRVTPSVSVASTHFDITTGLTTITTSHPHGLRKGSKFKVVDASSNNVGEFVVDTVAGITTFTTTTVNDINYAAGHKLYQQAFDGNNQSVPLSEAIGSRYTNLYAGEHATLKDEVDAVTTTIRLQVPNAGIGTDLRYKLGDYIEIESEIMRVSEQGLIGGGNDALRVIRGSMGTLPTKHYAGALIRKVNPLAIELRRPSILRASGHTFEYLGYGPGNYSTGLPQVQNRTLTDDEEYLSQAQERSAGAIVYTGLNNEGDFYIGNKRISSSSGEESSFGIPIPTVTGETASSNSVVFDEVIVRQRIIVEGGPQQNILSQFDGPVTFSNDVNFTDDLITSGTVELGGDIEITGSFPTGAKLNNVLVGVGTNLTEITTVPGSGDLVLNAATGFSVAIATDTKYTAKVTFEKQVNFNGFTTFSGDVFMSGAGFTYCGGPLHVCDDIVAFYGQTSDIAMKENVSTLDNPLAKVMQIRGTEYDWKEGNKSYKGHDVGVIAQDVEKVLPEAVSTKPDGTKGVHYNKLIPLLIEAVKDLNQQVDELKDK